MIKVNYVVFAGNKMASGSLYSIPQDEITHYLLYEMRMLTHMSQEECFLIEVASLCSRACSSAYLVYKPKFSRRPTPDLSTRNLFSTMALSKPFFLALYHTGTVPLFLQVALLHRRMHV